MLSNVSTGQYVAVMQLCMDTFPSCLSQVELRVFGFIVQRTLRFGKTSEQIPIRHFLEGVYDFTGKPVCCAATNSKRLLFPAIKSLESKGFIHISKAGKSNRYIVVEEELIQLGADQMSKLKESRQNRSKKNSNRFTSEPHDGSQVNHLDGSQVNHRSKRSKVRDLKVSESAKNLSDTIRSTSEANLKKVREKAEAAATRKSKVNSTAVWRVAMKDFYPEPVRTPELTSKQWGALKKASVDTPGPEYVKIIRWSVQNWGNLARHDLKWFDGISDIPSFPIFARLFKYFAAAYYVPEAQRRALRTRSGPSQRDSAETRSGTPESPNVSQSELQEAQRRAEHYRRLLLEANRKHKKEKMQSTANQDIPDELPDWEDM